MGLKSSIILFHVLNDVDLNKTIKKLPDYVTQIGGLGRGRGRFSQKPKFDIFFEAFPRKTMCKMQIRVEG